MTKIVRSKDCGNSPKNPLVENLAVALSTGDHRMVSELVTDDVQWSIVGGKVLRGREAVLQALSKVACVPIATLTVLHVVTHGRSGAVNGKVQHSAGGVGFCDVFEFSTPKGTNVSRITSYRLKVEAPRGTRAAVCQKTDSTLKCGRQQTTAGHERPPRRLSHPADFRRPSDAVAAMGVPPVTITDIIISHVHWDHLDGADLFPNARIWIQRAEYEYYVGPKSEALHGDISAVDAAMLARLAGSHWSRARAMRSSLVSASSPAAAIPTPHSMRRSRHARAWSYSRPTVGISTKH